MGLSNKYGRFKMKLPEYASSRIRERKFMTGLFSAVGNENKKGSRFFGGDQFLDFTNIKPIDIGWIKIDVEGFEKNVIEGFSNSIKETNSVFEVEINANTMRMGEYSSADLIDIMYSFDYFPYVEGRYMDGIKSSKRDVFDIYFAKLSAAKNFSQKLNLVKLPKEYSNYWDNMKFSK